LVGWSSSFFGGRISLVSRHLEAALSSQLCQTDCLNDRRLIREFAVNKCVCLQVKHRRNETQSYRSCGRGKASLSASMVNFFLSSRGFGVMQYATGIYLLKASEKLHSKSARESVGQSNRLVERIICVGFRNRLVFMKS
jgi:hypothetical protein